jgi:Cu(I)/Ag(I) efflux system protein CusF
MTKTAIVAALLAMSAAPAYAQQSSASGDHASHHPTQTKPASAALADGEVRKVDMDARKITLRHGPIQNLDMPAMTMVFQVKDPNLLNKVKTGDKVRFAAEKTGGAYIVTNIEPVR